MNPLLKRILAIVAIAVVPAAVLGVFLGALASANAGTASVPAAIVNQDKLVTTKKDGKTSYVAAGRLVVTNLTKQSGATSAIDFTLSNASEAKQDLADGSVYAVVTIPKDFSKAISTQGTADATQSHIRITTDEAHGYLVSQVAGALGPALTSSLGSTTATSVIEGLYSGFSDVGNSLSKAASGAGSLGSGAGGLADGLTKLASGQNGITSGAQQLGDGAAQLGSGASSLAAGLEKAASGTHASASGAAKLADGVATYTKAVDSLAAGLGTAASDSTDLQQLPTGVEQYTAGVSSLSSGLQEASSGTTAYTQGVSAASSGLDAILANGSLTDAQKLAAIQGQVKPGLDTAATEGTAIASGAAQSATAAGELASGGDALVSGAKGAASLQSSLATIAAGAEQLSAGSAPLRSGTSSLASGLGTLAVGLDASASGAGSLASGAESIATGATGLASGSSQLADGTSQSASGARSLQDGASKLSSGLQQGADQVPSYTSAQSKRIADAATQPVTTSSSKTNVIAGIAQAVATLIIPVGLWIGASAIVLLFGAVRRRLLATGVGTGRLVGGAYLRGGAVAVGQAVVLVAVLEAVTPLTWAALPAEFGIAALAALTFFAIHQLLGAIFGRAGTVVSVLLLGLQLVAVGGLYPIQLVSSPFQAISPYLPLTAAVTAMQSIAAGSSSGVAGGIALLVVVGLLAFGVTTAVTARRRSSPRFFAQPAPSAT